MTMSLIPHVGTRRLVYWAVRLFGAFGTILRSPNYLLGQDEYQRGWGKRLKENDGIPMHEDPFMYGENGPQPKEEEHTCRLGIRMRRRSRTNSVDEYLRVPV